MQGSDENTLQHMLTGAKMHGFVRFDGCTKSLHFQKWRTLTQKVLAVILAQLNSQDEGEQVPQQQQEAAFAWSCLHPRRLHYDPTFCQVTWAVPTAKPKR